MEVSEEVPSQEATDKKQTSWRVKWWNQVMCGVQWTCVGVLCLFLGGGLRFSYAYESPGDLVKIQILIQEI